LTATAGSYEFRYLQGGGFTSIATSNSVAVNSPAVAPAFTASASASVNPVSRGKSTTISLTVTDTGGALSSGIVDLEIYNSAGTQVKQKYWTSQSFSAGQKRSYSFSWTAPSTTGTYTVKIGVFGPNWSPMYYWNNGAVTIKVQ
jgi:hypothetical protein